MTAISVVYLYTRRSAWHVAVSIGQMNEYAGSRTVHVV